MRPLCFLSAWNMVRICSIHTPNMLTVRSKNNWNIPYSTTFCWHEYNILLKHWTPSIGCPMCTTFAMLPPILYLSAPNPLSFGSKSYSDSAFRSCSSSKHSPKLLSILCPFQIDRFKIIRLLRSSKTFV